MNDIKFTLKGARANAGLTQTQVCKELGIAMGTLVRWENGKSSPTLSQARELCSLYGISLDDLSNN